MPEKENSISMAVELSYLTKNTELRKYAPLPQSLIVRAKELKLSDSSLILYSVLLNRALLSRQNGWFDQNGYVYIRYPIEKLAEDLRKSPPTIKNLLKRLDDAGLIERRHGGYNRCSKIFVRIPIDYDTQADEGLYPGRQEYSGQKWRKSATSNNTEEQYRLTRYSYEEGESL